jgi:hypothetical protein
VIELAPLGRSFLAESGRQVQQLAAIEEERSEQLSFARPKQS